MISLAYQDQQIEELKYNLLTTTELEQELKIIDDKDIVWNQRQINLAIIGASHRVQVVQPTGNSFIEVLACVNLDQLQPEPVVKKEVFTSKQLKVDYDISNLNYQFELEVLSFTNEQQYQQFNKSLAKHEKNYFYHLFPGSTEAPITGIKHQQDENKLKWITFHSYETEKKVVKTTSVIKKLT